MKVEVFGIVDIKCQGCGAVTRLIADKTYTLPSDIMCNCDQQHQPITLSNTNDLISAVDVDEVIAGLFNGAELTAFDIPSQLMYAKYIIGEYEQDKKDGVKQDAHDHENYAICSAIVAAEEPDTNEAVAGEDDTIDLTELKKPELKKICAEFTPPIVVPKRATNDQIITLILTAQEG